ncbi:MAG: methyltransferase domain-containing protein [Acidimicrobiales bacterium]
MPANARRPKTYDSAFYAAQSAGSRRSAAVVVRLVNNLLRPKSVLDVGCGLGTWLAEWIACGTTDVLGLDGGYVQATQLQIPRDAFRPLDLTRSFSLGRRFDLVESLEVAEHLDESCADSFVESLSAHADNVLFSAAIPRQGGYRHVNEQWPSYWIPKFSRLGLRVFDIVRPAIWDCSAVDYWYRQNILLFSRTLDAAAHGTYIDVVHPAMWDARDDLTLGQLIKELPSAAFRALHTRLPKFRMSRSDSRETV